MLSPKIRPATKAFRPNQNFPRALPALTARLDRFDSQNINYDENPPWSARQKGLQSPDDQAGLEFVR